MESGLSNRETKGHQRDLALILLGMSLVKSERESILASVPSGAVCREVDGLFDALRLKEWGRVKTWLETRGARIENGLTPAQAVVEAVKDIERKANVRRIVGELSFAVKLEDVTQLKERLTKCLTELEAI